MYFLFCFCNFFLLSPFKKGCTYVYFSDYRFCLCCLLNTVVVVVIVVVVVVVGDDDDAIAGV